MITKPISLSPDSESISIENYAYHSSANIRGSISLTAEIHNGSTLETYKDKDGNEYCYASLILNVNGRDYVFVRPYGSDNSKYMEYSNYYYVTAKVEQLKHSIKVTITLDLYDNMAAIAKTGRWVNSSYTMKTYESPKVSDLISNGENYSWKIRLFDKDSLSGEGTYVAKNIMAYGTVENIEYREIPEAYRSDDDIEKENVLKIFPHTNIYDAVLGNRFINGISYDLDSSLITEAKRTQREYVQETVLNIVKYCDANMRYYIKIHGKQYPIKYYRLYNAKSETEHIFTSHEDYDYDGEFDHGGTGIGSEGDPYYSIINEYFDGYGNPIAGYAVIDSDVDLTAIISPGDTYQICCNYVDSPNAYFEVYSKPTITVTCNGYSDETRNNVSSSTDRSTLGWQNLILNIDYSQDEGIEPSYYYFKVYEYDETDTISTLKYTSPNQYGQDLVCEYDNFVNNRHYQTVVSVVDERNNTHDISWDWETHFGYDEIPEYITAEYYAEHNSVIIDWSDIDDYIEDMSIISGFKVYKQIGESAKLYEIGNIVGKNCRVLEDFVVGDNCKYTYFVYPIRQDCGYLLSGEENYDYRIVSGLQAIYKPVKTNEITLNYGVDKVFALTSLGDNTYEVNLDWVWRLYLNLKDTGFNINNDKTFYDTLAKYTQENVGNRNYITKSINALIGSIDCSSGEEYLDTYDMLVSWRDFVTSPDLKCLVDTRGLILPGNFEANPSVDYLECSSSPASAKFNWRQKSDLDIIKIYGTILPVNPLRESFLSTNDYEVLTSFDKYMLTGDNE